MTATNEGGNGQRVTNAQVVMRLDRIEVSQTKFFDETSKKIDYLVNCYHQLDKTALTNTTRIDNLWGDVKDLESKSNRWDIGNSIANLLTALLAIFGLTRS